jgi:predicted transcriptional regulator
MRVKKLVYLDAEQDKRVKQLARKAKTSETEVIRRAIDAYGRDEAAQIARDKRRVMEYVKAHPAGWADDPAEFFHE